MAIQAINSQAKNNSVANVSFDRSGNRTTANRNEETKRIADLADKYYGRWNKIKLKGTDKGLGIGAVVAIFEMATGTILGILEGGPATLTNLATTLSENIQVVIAGYESAKGLKTQEELKANKENRELGMAMAVAASGGLGFYQWAKEIKGESHEVAELPPWQKTGLTAASLVSAAMMGIGYVEKSIMAALAKGENGGERASEINLNARSDGRCCGEWLTMAAYLWIRNIKSIKMLIDFLFPFFALKDGLGDLYEAWSEKRNGGGENNRRQEKIYIPEVAYNQQFLGRNQGEGIRSRVLVPIFKQFGCEPFECHLNTDKELMVALPNEKFIKQPEPRVADVISRPEKVINKNSEQAVIPGKAVDHVLSAVGT